MPDLGKSATDVMCDEYESECPVCGGEGFVFECFDGFCLDADVGCDDCTRPCDCQKPRRAESDVLRHARAC